MGTVGRASDGRIGRRFVVRCLPCGVRRCNKRCAVGWLLGGFSIPSRDDTDVLTALEGIPGALIGMALAYAEGVRRGNEALEL